MIWLQLCIFGSVGFLIYYGIYYGTPKLTAKGVPLLYAFWFNLWWPVLLLLPLSLCFAIFIDGVNPSLQSIAERFRLNPISNSDWGWIASAVVLTIVFDQLLEPIGKLFAKVTWLQPPRYLPSPFNPLQKIKLPFKEFFGAKLKGNWILLCMFIPIHIIAMFSEEMMWRGYFLPIQESIFGSYAWIINGLMWAWLVHACFKWHFISMLPGMLIAPLIAQYTESTWASFMTHAIPNSLLWIFLLLGVIHKSKPKNQYLNNSNS